MKMSLTWMVNSCLENISLSLLSLKEAGILREVNIEEGEDIWPKKVLNTMFKRIYHLLNLGMISSQRNLKREKARF
jgi:hypothetical protein